MRNRRILWKIIKLNRLDRILMGYLAELLVICALLWLLEPGLPDFGTALWYCFSLITTIGLGDVTAVSFLGRALSIVLGLSSLIMVALITGTVVNFYQEVMKVRRNEGVLLFLDKMERLEDLPREELAEMSEKVRRLRLRKTEKTVVKTDEGEKK